MHRHLPLAIVGLLTVAAAQDAPRPRVGLVLSGGGARGAAHIGVLKVLEELHVPVDFVVGTSMGAIVGGLYASGYSPAELDEIVSNADWARILSDAPPRDELWFRRREDDRAFLIDLELGWKDGPALPSGLVLGRNVDAFLARLTLHTWRSQSFDDLQLPFRCVATDIADGSTVVFDSGTLAEAIRASMSIPGVFAPVQVEGRYLVDGGVVQNLPVETARGLGADVVIAVDVSTPLQRPDLIHSLVGVSDQVVGILMAENRKRSRAALGPRDLLLEPELGDLATMEFGRAHEAIGIGRAVAEARRDDLQRLAVDDATWRAFVARQRRPDFVPPRIRGIRIENRTGLSDAVIAAHVAATAGAPLDPATLDETRDRLAGLGIVDRVAAEVVPADGGDADLVVRASEKDWGPNYLRVGLGAQTDLQGTGSFGFAIQHTWTPANAYGGEWRNEFEIGSRTRLKTEFYQPLDPGLRWFVAPSFEYEQRTQPLIVQRLKVAEVDLQGYTPALDLGRNLGDWGEIRVGYHWLHGRAQPTVVLPGILPSEVAVETGSILARLLLDTLDDVRFPRSGWYGGVNWEFADESLGGDQRLSVLQGGLGKPLSFGELTVLPAVEGGSAIEGSSRFGGRFYLGGFRRLSGLEHDELYGNHYLLGSISSYYRLTQRTSRFDTAMYVGGTAELGGIWTDKADVSGNDMILAGSAFVGADTFIGPAYVAIGFAEGGDRAAYVFIGPTF